MNEPLTVGGQWISMMNRADPPPLSERTFADVQKQYAPEMFDALRAITHEWSLLLGGSPDLDIAMKSAMRLIWKIRGEAS